MKRGETFLGGRVWEEKQWGEGLMGEVNGRGDGTPHKDLTDTAAGL